MLKVLMLNSKVKINMAEEKETPEITNDDLDALSYLLQNVKGLSTVSSTDYRPTSDSEE